jgi:osmotically-inducible protein OsmY
MPESEEVIRQVRAALERDSRVNLHRHPIAVDCEPDGTIVLEGETESIAAKKIALELAAAVPGCTGIADRLRVTPAIPMGDGAIRDRVRDSLLEEQSLARCAIYVRDGDAVKLVRESAVPRGDCIEAAVGDGVVTLDGRVESLSHKRLAGLLAWWVPGTRDVINGIEVQPPQEDCDDEISDAVRVALEKDKLLRSDSIRITTQNAVVTLEGIVANDRQAAMAEADAWYIFGVDRVINHLRTQG